MLTSESRRWPVEKARGAILVTPQNRRAEPAPGKGRGQINGPRSLRVPFGKCGRLGSFLYFITIFLKHAFERIGKGELDLLPRAFSILVERLTTGLKPPVRGP